MRTHLKPRGVWRWDTATRSGDSPLISSSWGEIFSSASGFKKAGGKTLDRCKIGECKVMFTPILRGWNYQKSWGTQKN
jgi:hypothetical protein